MEDIPSIIRVKCRQQAYYRDQMREKGNVINFYTEDMDKGVYRVGPNKGKPKPPMPKWAEVVPPETPLTVIGDNEPEDVTTLSQMSKRGTPAQQAELAKEKQTLAEERKAFEEEKTAFEALKDNKEPKKEETVSNPTPAKKEWRGATKKKTSKEKE